MRSPGTYKWIGLALIGLAIAVVVAVAASNLISQQIGIASESVSAGDALAPAVSSVGGKGSKPGRSDASKPGSGEQAGAEPAEPAAPAEPGDDHGSGGGEDGGEGSDD